MSKQAVITSDYSIVFQVFSSNLTGLINLCESACLLPCWSVSQSMCLCVSDQMDLGVCRLVEPATVTNSANTDTRGGSDTDPIR